MSQNVTLSAIISAARSPHAGVEGPRAAVRHAVYTGVQMLEIHPKLPFPPLLGTSARCPGGTARSARRCSIMSSDMTHARPGHPKTEWVRVHRKRHINFR